MTMTRIQKKIADKFMEMTIKAHVKNEYHKIGVHPTAEQVFMNIKGEALDKLMQNGYTVEEIKEIIAKVVRRK